MGHLFNPQRFLASLLRRKAHRLGSALRGGKMRLESCLVGTLLPLGASPSYLHCCWSQADFITLVFFWILGPHERHPWKPYCQGPKLGVVPVTSSASPPCAVHQLLPRAWSFAAASDWLPLLPLWPPFCPFSVPRPETSVKSFEPITALPG